MLCAICNKSYKKLYNLKIHYKSDAHKKQLELHIIAPSVEVNPTTTNQQTNITSISKQQENNIHPITN
jgi:hypothetical protein